MGPFAQGMATPVKYITCAGDERSTGMGHLQSPVSLPVFAVLRDYRRR